VPRRRGDHAALALLVGQTQQRVACAALLEAAGALQVIELAVDVRAGELRQRNRLDAWRLVNAACNAFARGLDVGERQHDQNGSTASGFARASTRRHPSWLRGSAASWSASNRSTTTGVVLDARASPKPSGYSTRRPSMRITSVAPGNSSDSAMRATSACGSPSAQGIVSSGVETASGSASSVADGSRCRDRISSSRAPAYRPSSKPYQRSPKNVWPLISPANAACVSFIFALISE